VCVCVSPLSVNTIYLIYWCIWNRVQSCLYRSQTCRTPFWLTTIHQCQGHVYHWSEVLKVHVHLYFYPINSLVSWESLLD